MATIARPSIPAEWRDEFAAEIRGRTAEAIWVVTWIAAVLYPVTTFLDRYLYPESFGDLSIVRFATLGGLLALALVQAVLRHRRVLPRYADLVAVLLILVVLASQVGFCAAVGGADTPYYAGMMLMLTGILVAFPWGAPQLAATCVAAVAVFDAATLLVDRDIVVADYVTANYMMLSMIFIGTFWILQRDSLRAQGFVARKQLVVEKLRSEALLLNILPPEVADELKRRGRVDARLIEDATIVFTDFVGFTDVTSRADPAAVVESLDRAFTRFDGIVTRWGLEKVKTIGDAYMCAGGVPEPQPTHRLNSVLAALEMLHVLEHEDLFTVDGRRWQMRIGIQSGPVVAGVIGRTKSSFDLWGDTVNTASRLEAAGLPGSVNVLTPLYEEMSRFFEGLDRGVIPVRGKKDLPMTAIQRLRPQYSADAGGRIPNPLFWEHVRGSNAAGTNPPQGLSWNTPT